MAMPRHSRKPSTAMVGKSRGIVSARRKRRAAHLTAARIPTPLAARPDGRAAGHGYLLLTYFSRRTCGVGRPAAFSTSKVASTMSGLPHR